MKIGIDLGGTNIAAGLTDGGGKIFDKVSAATKSARSPEKIADDMIRLINNLLKRNGVKKAELTSIGIGSPGIVDDETGKIIHAANLNADNFSFRDYISREFDCDIHIANDADCAALGEYTVSGNGASRFILITLGTGVGCGIIFNGKLYLGFNGIGSELGHMTIVSGGKRCSCGKRGCFEAYASVTALKRQTAEALRKNPQSLMKKHLNSAGEVSGRTAFLAAREGDRTAAEVVRQYTRYVADGIVSIENIFQPDVIAIGGGISKEGDNLLRPVLEYVKKTRFNKYAKQTQIKTASLFNDAGIIGAAMLGK